MIKNQEKKRFKNSRKQEEWVEVLARMDLREKRLDTEAKKPNRPMWFLPKSIDYQAHGGVELRSHPGEPQEQYQTWENLEHNFH